MLRSVASLDQGEAEAITLAGELGAELIVDEYQGRKIALARGIQIIGTVGLVMEAARGGFLTDADVEPLLRHMVRANFRISKRLTDQ
jgi:predicted nucleic acid-binding protein